MEAEIQKQVALVVENIDHAARETGRTGQEITLVAVSKTKPLSMIECAYEAGVRIFGENKVQELTFKHEQCALPVSWHFIGHLQTNKVKQVLGKVDLIHSLDSVKLANEISRLAMQRNLTCDVLIQVNTSGEETKFGVAPETIDDLLKDVLELPGIHVKGLMTIGPLSDDRSKTIRSFELLKKLYDRLASFKSEKLTMKYLSMGMSGDYQIAIREGSNLVRLGTIIFGSRN